jgi:hypothetical protein
MRFYANHILPRVIDLMSANVAGRSLIGQKPCEFEFEEPGEPTPVR